MVKKQKPKIEWHVERKKVEDLIPWEDNPRIITQKMYEKLKESILRDGIFSLPHINTDNVIIGGHQRKQAFLDLGIDEVDCLVPHRKLNEKEFMTGNLASNVVTGEWDADILANVFDPDVLTAVGFVPAQMGGFDPTSINVIPEEEDEAKEREFDESIIDGEQIMVTFKVVIPNAESSSFENQLDELIAKFPTAKKDKILPLCKKEW